MKKTKLFMFILNLYLAALLIAQEKEDDSEFLLAGDDAGITVTASAQSTSLITVIDREDIERLHAPDLGFLLQESAGLGLVRYGPYGNQADMSMRGFDSERIAFLIDGVPVNSPVSGDIDLSLIDLSAVERIEIIYGGSDSRYNVTGALGGVINIITVKQEKQKLRLSGSIANTAFMPGEYAKPNAGSSPAQWQDLFDTQRLALSLGLGFEKASLSASLFANRAGNHFLFEDYYGRTLRRENNEVVDTGLSLSFVKELSNQAQFSATGTLYYGDKNIPLSGISSEAEKQRDFSSRQSLSFKVPRTFTDKLSTELTISHAQHIRTYAGSSRHDQHSLSVISRLSWYLLEDLSLRAGGDFRSSFLDSNAMGKHARGDGGLSLSAEYRPISPLLIIPSFKAVFSGSEAFPVVAVPKIGLLFQATESLTIKNNYFRSFKLPDFEDLYWKGGGMYGDPALKPEDGWGMDIGAAYTFNEKIGIEGGFFTQWTEDSIHWYSSGGIWKPTNVGKAVFFGVDSTVRWGIPFSPGAFEKLELAVFYQYLLTYLLSYGYDYASDKRIPYMPLHRAGFSATLNWKELGGFQEGSLLLCGQYEGPRFADTANLSKLTPYLLLNVKLNQRLHKNYAVFVDFCNILNQSYESFNDYYMPGLSVTIGIQADFTRRDSP
jgi:vitamin B12 transporter